MHLMTFIPDAAIWTVLISGFGAVVLVARVRASRGDEWEGLVSRLSGRIRED